MNVGPPPKACSVRRVCAGVVQILYWQFLQSDELSLSRLHTIVLLSFAAAQPLARHSFVKVGLFPAAQR
jgi:hypothetical protein